MPGNDVVLKGFDHSADISALNLQIIPGSRSTLGLSLIYLNFSSGTNGLGTFVDVSIPFTFYDGGSKSQRRRSRNLLQANTTDSVVSIWPSRGKQNMDVFVTVRLRRWQQFTAEWTEVPGVEELQVISLCSGDVSATGLCEIHNPAMCAQRVECNQQIPLSSISSSQEDITLQYRTLPSVHTGKFRHMLSYRGSMNISLAPFWYFEYTTADFATVDLVVPSYAQIEGGSPAQIFLSQLRLHTANAPSVFVKVGSSEAIVTSILPWDSINGTMISVRIPPSETAAPGFANLSVIVSSSQIYSILFEYMRAESLKIISITPSRGPADGSIPTVVLVERDLGWSQGPSLYRVAVDGVYCLT
jgi:hypothetical protein